MRRERRYVGSSFVVAVWMAVLLVCGWAAMVADAGEQARGTDIVDDLLLGEVELEDAKRFVFDDLEDPQWGNVWSTLEYKNADPEMYLVGEPVHSGRGAGKFDIKPGGYVRIIVRRHGLPKAISADQPNWQYFDARCPYPLPGKPKGVGVWVFGKKGGQRIRVNISDHSGRKSWRTFDLGVVDFEGWKLMRANITGGKKPLAPVYPWFLGAFEIKGPPNNAPADTPTDIYIDDVTVWTETTDKLVMRAQRYSGGFCDKPCVAGKPFEVRVWADNLTDKKIVLPVRYTVTQEKPLKEEIDRVLPTGMARIPLGPEAHGEARFTLKLPAGVYRIGLSASFGGQTKDFSLSSIPVFPEKGLDAAVPPAKDFSRKLQGHDMYFITSALAPGALLWTSRPGLCFFDGLGAWGLGGPTHMAVPTTTGVKIVKAGSNVPVSEMSEPWVLVWHNGAAGWTALTEKSQDNWRGQKNMNCDSPWLLVFQRKPSSMKMPDRRGGLAVSFPDKAGYAVMVPFFGARVPLAKETETWSKGLPADVLAKCRKLAAASHYFAVETTESFAVDFDADKVHVRERIRYISFEDEWGFPAKKYAPLPPMMGLAIRAKANFLSFQPADPVDMEMPLSVGPWYAIPDADEYTWTVSGLLKYICAIDTPKKARLEDPRVKEAYDAIVRKKLKGNTNLNWYICGEIARWLPNSAGALAFLEEPLKSETRQYLRWVSLQTVVPNNLHFKWDGRMIRASDGLAGYDIIYFNPSDYGVFAAYGLASRDRKTVASRWRYLTALLTNFRGSPWDTLGWPGGLAGEGYFSFVVSAINHARLSHMAGDGVGYRYGIFLAARALLAYYGVGIAAPDYVKSLSPWPMMDMRIKQDATSGKFYNGPRKGLDKGMMAYENWVRPVCDWEDFSFTDSWGGNFGFGPWANIVRPDTPLGENFHEGIGRFWRDQMGGYMKYWLDRRYQKFMPEWYEAVVVKKTAPEPSFIDRRTGQPVWLKDPKEKLGSNRHMNLRLRRLVFGEGVEDIYRMYQAMQVTRCGSIWAVLEAGADWQTVPLSPMPYEVNGQLGYELGNEREGGSGGTTRSLWTQTIRSSNWPVLAYYGYYPPKMPKLGATNYGVLPGTGYIRTDENDSIVEAKQERLTWNAAVWHCTVESVTDEDIARANELRQKLGVLADIVKDGYKGDIDACVRAYNEGAKASWMVASPFFTESAGSGFTKDYGPEAGVNYDATYKDDRGNSVRWRALRMSDFVIDFAVKLTRQENVLVYAATNIYSPADMEVYLATGSDDGIRVWLNGELVLDKRVWRGVALDQEFTRVALKKGWNRALVKVDQGRGEWAMAFRVADINYRLPVPGIRISPKVSD